MASQLPFPGGWAGNNETALVLAPPLVIPPEQPSSAGLEAGIEGFSPDRLLQHKRKRPASGTSVSIPSTPPPTPTPPSLRRVHRSCCSSNRSSNPKGKHRAKQLYKQRIGSVLRGGCCLFAAVAAMLTVYWSLSPLCTNCHGLAVWSISSSSSSAVEIAALDSAVESVQPFSTLRINQLQVRSKCLVQTACCHE